MNKDLNLLTATGLIDVQFANFGQDIVLEFCSSETGQSVAYLICHHLLSFQFMDNDFKQGQYPQQCTGFSHYVHSVSVQKKEQHYCVSLQPFVNVQIECLDYEILDSHQVSFTVNG